jgi:hypothetical protein
MRNITLWPEEVIELNRELASGLHPQLEGILGSLPAFVDMPERIGHIAAYCELVLDGAYNPDELAKLCGILVERLKDKRTRPDGILIVQ